MQRFTSIAALTALLITAAACGDDSSSADTTVAAENDAVPTRNTAKNPCADVMSGAQFLNSTTVDGKQVHLYLRTDAGKVEVVLLNAETCAQENAYVLALAGG